MAKNGYNNLMRTGTRSSVTADPRRIAEDFDEKVRTLDPESTPLQFLSSMIGRGKPPVAPKIQMIMHDSFDHFDKGSVEALDSTERFARLSVQQISRPTTSAYMVYASQDKFYVPETNQTLEVFMTPFDRISVNGGDYTASTGLTGNTTTATSAGRVVVRNVVPQPILPFTNGTIVYLGRTIRESQRVGGISKMEDFWYDCNFVEHKEEVLHMTEDQKKWIKTKNSAPDFTFQQEEMMKRFKKSVEYSLFFSERSVNYDEANRPTRHMRGLIHHIQSNVSLYNPYATVDFEELVLNFMSNHAFKFSPRGKVKTMMCGEKFLVSFNRAFKDFRRMDINDKEAKPGLDIKSYTMPGGFELKIMRNDIFRGDMEYWGVVVDASECEVRVVKDYESRFYSNNDERDVKFLVEWQGTVAWNREETHALLRTP